LCSAATTTTPAAAAAAPSATAAETAAATPAALVPAAPAAVAPLSVPPRADASAMTLFTTAATDVHGFASIGCGGQPGSSRHAAGTAATPPASSASQMARTSGRSA